MKNQKVYISGRITGDPHYREKFARAERVLRRRGYEPVNPTKGEPDGKEWTWYMRRDIKKLCDCDRICMLNDWPESKGATVENSIARELGMPVMYLGIDQGGILTDVSL